MQKIIAEQKEKDRHMRVLHAINDSHIEQAVPPIPKYHKVKLKFTPLSIIAFAGNFIYNLRP